jgi:hypothetical protein
MGAPAGTTSTTTEATVGRPAEDLVTTLRHHAAALVSLAEAWPMMASGDEESRIAVATEAAGLPAAVTDLRSMGDWLTFVGSATDDGPAAGFEPRVAPSAANHGLDAAHEREAAHLTTLAGRLLVRACELLDRVDVRPEALHAAVAAVAVSPHRLSSAAQLVERAVEFLHQAASLVEADKHRRRAHVHDLDVLRHHPAPRSGAVRPLDASVAALAS